MPTNCLECGESSLAVLLAGPGTLPARRESRRGGAAASHAANEDVTFIRRGAIGWDLFYFKKLNVPDGFLSHSGSSFTQSALTFLCIYMY